jgi:flagellar hook-associated protein 2
VQIGPGQYTLQLSAKQSGQTAAFTDGSLPTGLALGAATTTVQGTDARLKVGDTADAYEVTSSTNTFADVLAGVTVTAARKQAETDPLVTIDLTADTDGIAAKVKALVDNANVALSEIASQTKGKNGPVAGGPLAGDSAMRKITQDILSTVGSGAGALGSFKAVGVSLSQGGQLTFDKDAFVKAYTADPAKTQAYFDSYTEKDSKTDLNPAGKGVEGKFEPGWDVATGLARKLETLALIASEGVVRPDNPTAPKLGIVPGLMQRQNDNIRQLNDQVAAWDTRLELRRSGLEKQFSNLEVALGKMKQQSSWLAGQLAGLA